MWKSSRIRRPALEIDRREPRVSGVWLLALSLAWAGGCASGRIEGVVVRAERPGLTMLPADQRTDDLDVLPRAQVTMLVDPRSGRPERSGPVYTDDTGRFSIPVRAPGAGFLEYDLGVLVRVPGWGDFYDEIPFPSRRGIMVINVPRGQAGLLRPIPTSDDVDEMLRYWDRY